jgi:hypothetical protein
MELFAPTLVSAELQQESLVLVNHIVFTMSCGSVTENSKAVDSRESQDTQYSLYGKWQKRYIVGLVALAAWFSTLSSFIYYPAISIISEDLRLSIGDINLSITTYMAFSAIAPSITG